MGSTLAQWVGSCGVQLQPLVDALRQEVLAHSIVHADETPVQMLKRGSERDGKTHRAYGSNQAWLVAQRADPASDGIAPQMIFYSPE